MNRVSSVIRIAIALICTSGAVWASSLGFQITNIASDQSGVAPATDPDLVNPWGLAASGTSPWWIGNNGTGTSVLYNGAGGKLGLVVTIPGDGSVTGVLFSGIAGQFNGDTFLFDSEDGTVSGWRGALGMQAEVLATGNAGNVYKGIAEAAIGANTYAYLANFRAGTVDVLKGDTAAPDLTGKFTDPNLPAGYAPFDVQNINNVLYVTYAVQDSDKKDDVPGVGNGIVDTFDVNGNFTGRVITGGMLDSPWGLALAPAGFGDLGGSLLVGNFGNGAINAYNPTSGAFIETLQDQNGSPIAIDGLWSLGFGNGNGSGPTGTLFFTAGPDDESHGLFGRIDPVPEPGTAILFTAVGLLFVVWRTGRRSRCA
ncbi:MAG TPA: TIGR03118 family protein [Bryobacteraceae bacterium]|nr:TIGR03118 family protein [Bryobacteraceae bacterium]